MTPESESTLEQRAAQRRARATAVAGNGFPSHGWTLITDPVEAEKSLEALWELSCFLYGYPVDRRMDKSVVRMGRKNVTE
jgi:hypothetical protein